MAELDPLGELLSANVASGGLPALLLVPDPSGSAKGIVHGEDALVRVFELLSPIVCRDSRFGTGVDQLNVDVKATDWAEAYRKVVSFVVWLLSDEQSRERFLSGDDGRSPAVQSIRFVGSPEETELDNSVKLERLLIFAFVMGLMMARITALTGGGLGAVLPMRPDLTVLDMISLLTSQAAGEEHDAHSRAAASMASCLASATAHYGRVGEHREQAQLQVTASSILRVQEFAFLATRAPHMVERYGLKAVEERFEQQLNLALQTLGFRTVPTTRGARRGDIICLTDGVPPSALLVEAKTSVHPYKLPVADERALLEYSEKLKLSSRFPFQLRLIWIVGPEPDKRLAERLRLLEAKTGIPVRYCSGAVLVALLARPPFGVTTEEIVTSLLNADQIVLKTHLMSMSSEAEEELAAFRSWINIILRLR